MGNLMIAFAYYGGKFRHLKEILPLLPEADHYCEPFSGSAAVLLNKKRSPIETLNDLNSDIVNFFQVLRDQPQQLVIRLQLTPYARQEFYNAWESTDCPVERARRFFIRATMDIAKAGAKKDRSFSTNASYDRSKFSSAPWNMISKIDNLMDVASRLRGVQIENRPAIELIRKYDRPQTLFYCDPPYLPETRTSANDYAHEMTINDHQALAFELNQCKGMVALSGYDSNTMEILYPPDKWFKTGFKRRCVPMSRSRKLIRQEVLWTNYDPNQLHGQISLFHQ